MDSTQLKDSITFAAELIASGKADQIMPRDKLPDVFDTPVTAYRWHSLTAEG
jgi:hypothetical protein